MFQRHKKSQSCKLLKYYNLSIRNYQNPSSKEARPIIVPFNVCINFESLFIIIVVFGRHDNLVAKFTGMLELELMKKRKNIKKQRGVVKIKKLNEEAVSYAVEGISNILDLVDYIESKIGTPGRDGFIKCLARGYSQ